jgi:predicted N-acetyltransferase YhbS
VFRNPVVVREATPDDAEALLEVWAGSSPTPGRVGGERDDCPAALDEAVSAIARVAASADQRFLVAVTEGQVIGAVHLIRTQLSPMHSESAVHLAHLNVHEAYRRHGVGRALVEAAVSWAEEKDSGHLLASASANSREANRFMARLGLTQIAVIRGATTPSMRGRLPVEPPAAARVGSRSSRRVGHVLAQRRSLRRAQAREE